MFHAALDPALLFPPKLPDISAGDWIIKTREWTEIAAGGVVTASCPRALHEKALGVWYEQREAMIANLVAEGSPFSHHEMVVVLEELRGRLAPKALADHDEVALASLELQPAYAPPRLASEEVEIFEEHLGGLALLRKEMNCVAMTLTERASWRDDPNEIRIEGEIDLYIAGGIEQYLGEERTGFVEHITGCCSLSDACEALMANAGKLSDYPRIAVEAAARVRGIDPSHLGFRIGQGFVGSVRRMNYPREDGRARTCWRAMASVAAGLVAEMSALNAHPQRIDEGPQSDRVTDASGRTLMRGHLALGSPNAHRLYWWNGTTPEFVGVAGHDDPPPL
jgi:hypothetical protein